MRHQGNWTRIGYHGVAKNRTRLSDGTTIKGISLNFVSCSNDVVDICLQFELILT